MSNFGSIHGTYIGSIFILFGLQQGPYVDQECAKNCTFFQVFRAKVLKTGGFERFSRKNKEKMGHIREICPG